MSIWGYGRERNGILGNLLNTHPMALKHLMPALMHFYIGQFPVFFSVNMFYSEWFPRGRADGCKLTVL